VKARAGSPLIDPFFVCRRRRRFRFQFQFRWRCWRGRWGVWLGPREVNVNSPRRIIIIALFIIRRRRNGAGISPGQRSSIFGSTLHRGLGSARPDKSAGLISAVPSWPPHGQSIGPLISLSVRPLVRWYVCPFVQLSVSQSQHEWEAWPLSA